MLELDHRGSSVCAAKVRLALAEKGLEWSGHYLGEVFPDPPLIPDDPVQRAKMEADLDGGPWLAGEACSLAAA